MTGEEAVKIKRTPVGRVSFPAVDIPIAVEEGQDKKFRLTLIFDKASQNTPEFKEMMRDVVSVRDAKFGTKKAGAQLPFRKCEEKAHVNGYDVEGGVFVTLTSKRKPQLFGPRGEELGPDDVYAGCYARATYRVFDYEKKAKYGVSLGLGNIQKARDGEPLSGGGMTDGSEFGTIETTSESIDDLLGSGA